MKKLIFALSLTLVFVLAYSFQSYSPVKKENKGIIFYKGSLKEAMIKAKKENKLIFLDVSAVWCGPCKLLKSTTFTEPAVGTYFNEKFISLEIDGEEGLGKEIVKKYQLKGYPSLLFIDSNGKLVKQSLGYYDGNQLLEIVHGLK
jgi:thioredoxin 1